MKLAQISKADSFGGGASRVAEDLTYLINKNGFSAHHLCSWSGKGFHAKENRYPLYGRFEREIRFLHSKLKRYSPPELIPFEYIPLIRKIKREDYNLLHFHDLSSAISPYTLYLLGDKIPVVWTLHDCSPFTGGCLYPMECKNFMENCGNCPQSGEWPIDSKIDFTSFSRKIKNFLHKSGRLCAITPSKWMSELAYSSGMFKSKPRVIPNAIDIKKYKPVNKKEIRYKLNLPLNRNLILLSAGNFLDERKGSKYALEGIKKVKHVNPHLVILGVLDEMGKKILSEFDYTSVGYVSDKDLLSLYYGCADIFMHCSLADNQPLSIIESMAMSTPIIGFKTGGIVEMIDQNKNGFLVLQKDINALADAIELAFENNNHISWGISSREKVLREYSPEIFLKNHLELYEEMIEKNLLQN